MAIQTQITTRPRLRLEAVAWVVILAVSVLPNALFHELAGGAPGWLTWAKLGLLAVLAGAAMAWHALRPLRNVFVLLLAIFAAEGVMGVLSASALWQRTFGSPSSAFAASMWSIQVGRLLVALAVIGVLVVLGYRRAEFYLVRGRLDAPIEPVRWLGFPTPIPWTRFGALWAVFIGLGLLVFLVTFGRPSAQTFALAAPLLPAVLLFAAMNAFSEEMTYRASLLAGLAPAVGSRQALWMTAAFFGLGHYFGVPYGVLGAAMAGFLGWLLGKGMLETRGFFWPWFIHCVQDVLIFSFMAAGSMTPGA